MTNFLTRLAARSFGVETGVRPRLASIFEPNRGAAAAAHGSSAREREEAEETAVQFAEADEARNRRRAPQRPAFKDPVTAPISEPAPQPPRRGEAVPASPAIVQSEGVRIERVSSQTAEGEIRHPIQAARSASSYEEFAQAPSRTDAPGSHRGKEERSASVPLAGPPPRAIGVNHEPVRLHPAEAADLRADRVAGDSMPARKAAPVDEAALMPPSQTIADLAERMRDAAALMNAAIVAPKRESSRDIDRSAMAAAEPVVHVTIGRVEVRATTETQRESKAKVASPVMGLEDYLQRRAQRGGQ